MFFQYPWNNFLHNVVFDIVQQVLNGSMDIGFNKYLAIDLFNRGDITNKIIEGQKSCNEFETKNNGLRLGFMGHLTLIAEEVVKFIQLYPVNSLSPLIDSRVESFAWEEYVNNILYDTRDKYNAILGGGDDDEEDPVNAFDESSGEIIDHGEYKHGLVFDPSEDPDILSGTYDENGDIQGNSKSSEKNDSADEPKDSDSSDESSEDDDDHFSSYMSQQLTNTASSDHGSFAASKKKAEYESKNESEKQPNDNMDEFFEEEKNDYIDPNDDGLSYKKDNPIYDFKGNLLYLSNRQEEDISSEDSASSSSSSSDDDIEIDDEEAEKTTDKESEVNHLTRETSKS